MLGRHLGGATNKILVVHKLQHCELSKDGTYVKLVQPSAGPHLAQTWPAVGCYTGLNTQSHTH